jgi:hypothetical protein
MKIMFFGFFFFFTKIHLSPLSILTNQIRMSALSMKNATYIEGKNVTMGLAYPGTIYSTI